ncbi:MAG: hypothetical protein HJJLKODD_02620 [Phycisphaerae bacterium]|nr:hypothetical protein [Phycisphaerae bacterium]
MAKQNVYKSPFLSDFKRSFMRGLAALLPTVFTIAVLFWAFKWVNSNVAVPITNGIITFLPDYVPAFVSIDLDKDPLIYGEKIEQWDAQGRQLTLEYQIINHPAFNHPDPQIKAAAKDRRANAIWHIVFKKWYLNIFGFIIAVVLIYITGYFLTGWLGRSLWRLVEDFLARIPMFSWLYSNIKQVTDFLLGDKKLDVAGVVAVEYPRKGLWSLGLITGTALKSISSYCNNEMVSVFIPTTPTPVTGFVIAVPKKEVIELAMGLDEALRFVISGGVIKPPTEGGRPDMLMQNSSAPPLTGPSTPS